MKTGLLIAISALLFSNLTFADEDTKVIPLDSCYLLSPLPTADEVIISYDDNCNVIASIDYVYKKRDTSLLVINNPGVAPAAPTQIIQQSILTQSFSQEANTPNSCGNNSQDDIDAATAQATQDLINSVAQFINTNNPVACQ